MTAWSFVLTFILAACSLLYELMIAQTVSLFAINNVVWYSLTVGIFIGSMGLGAFLSSRIFRSLPLWERLVQLEIILSLVGGLGVIAIHFGQAGAALLFAQGQLVGGDILFFIVAFIIAVAVGVLTGSELPLLIELAESAAPGTDLSARVIAMDYFGTLAGALLFPVVFIPRMDMLALSWLVALVNLAAAAGLSFRFRGSGGGNYGGFLTVFAGIFLALLLCGGLVQQYFLKMYYYYAYPREELRRDVFHRLTPYQSIDIVRLGAERNSMIPKIIAAYSQKYTRHPNLPRGFALYLNRDFQFYADVEEIYHETFAHVPIGVVGQVPRTVLIMGGGDGLLLRELLKYPGIRRVVQVEIDPDIVELFRSVPELNALTRNAYRDPRLSLVFDDAYNYIRQTGEVFDAIYLDFPAPVDFSLSKLYSREFYSLIRRHLSRDGFVVANAPGLMEDINQVEMRGRGEMKTWHIFSNTLEAAGFQEVRPFFALLEDDNPEAIAILKKENRLSANGESMSEFEDAYIKEDVRNILDNVTSGFLFARPVPGRIAPNFDSHGIELDVINSNRYALSIASHSQFQHEQDKNAVNSILHPRLPDLSAWWKVRTPY